MTQGCRAVAFRRRDLGPSGGGVRASPQVTGGGGASRSDHGRWSRSAGPSGRLVV